LIDNSLKLDAFDMKILNAMQNDASLSQRDLADKVGMSQNACWRRLQRLNSLGLIVGSHNVIDLKALGLDLTVFVMIRTSRHSREWSEAFRLHVERLPEVVDFYRIGGEWDYLIKVVTKGMAGYDNFYQKLITDFELATVTGFFSMEAIINNRPVDLISLR
jgi:Lrp/AsnC family transcriptional regulator